MRARFQRAGLCAAFSVCVFACSTEVASTSAEVVNNGCLPSGAPKGVDVWSGNGTIDWAKVKAAGISFAAIKATQSTDIVDGRFAQNWSGAKAAGVLRSPYHFFVGDVDGHAQAKAFLAAVGPMAAGDLPPMLDFECPDGSPTCAGSSGSGWAPDATVVQRALDWLHDVKLATGKTPIVYTYAWFVSSGHFGVDVSKLTAYPLWVANVGSTQMNYASCVSTPSPWTSSTFWQWGWHGWVNGIPNEVDVDHFIGTSSDLLALTKSTTTTTTTCPYGNGDYCGGNGVGGDPLSLYACSNGVLTKKATCSLGCVREPVGQNDVCASGSVCPSGNGDYCGGNGVGGDPSVLYHCDSGVLHKLQTCTNGCARMPTGMNDVCN